MVADFVKMRPSVARMDGVARDVETVLMWTPFFEKLDGTAVTGRANWKTIICASDARISSTYGIR